MLLYTYSSSGVWIYNSLCSQPPSIRRLSSCLGHLCGVGRHIQRWTDRRKPRPGVQGSELPPRLCRSHQPSISLEVSLLIAAARGFSGLIPVPLPLPEPFLSAPSRRTAGRSCRSELASLEPSLPAPGDPPRTELPEPRGSTPALLCYNEPF